MKNIYNSSWTNKKKFFLLIFLFVAVIVISLILNLLLVSSDEPQNLASIVTIIGLIAVTAKYFMSDYFGFKNMRARKEEAQNALNTVISGLSAGDNSAKLSAAIMLRRFLNDETDRDFPHLKEETIKQISSMLKVLPTGVYQKTLADGLAYAGNLSGKDLQRINMQDVYLGRKDGRKILVSQTDFYQSDFSYALIEGVEGDAVFYRSILFCTQIKRCDFTGASFCQADLTNVCFKNVKLKDADFTGALNIPQTIREKLVEKEGKIIYPDEGEVTARQSTLNKCIFFSMPSKMSKACELLTKDYERELDAMGYNVLFYTKDDYPSFGQLSKIREKILASSAMVVFGFKQTHISDATFRPETDDEAKWSDKWLATPWNEIEVGMGLMKGMPILLVKDPKIDMGIFDKNLSECFVANISTEYDSRKLRQNKEFTNWLSKIDV